MRNGAVRYRPGPCPRPAKDRENQVKAISYDQFGGPEVLQHVELPLAPLAAGQIRVDLRAASVIPGDTKVRAGLLRAIFAVSLPKIPGRDGAGIVAEIGADVTGFSVGDEVCVVAQHVEPGTNAQSIVVHPDALVAKPAVLDFAEAAALMHSGVCAWIGLVETAALKPGERVLIHAGAGAIGSMAVQLARHIGAEVIATASAKNIDYVRSLGADRVIAYDREDFAAELRDCDVVFDLIGGEVHARSFAVLKPQGRMACLIALPVAPPPAGAEGIAVRFAQIHDHPQVLTAITDLAARGILVPQVARRMPLDQAAEAHRLIEAGQVSRGRIVLEIPPLS